MIDRDLNSSWLQRQRIHLGVRTATLAALCMVGGFPLPVDWARAAAPPVEFDVAPLVACRDVTTPEFEQANPGECLLEARLEVSTLIDRDRDGELTEYMFRFTSPGHHLRIADYQPKTTLASDYASNISVERRNETTKSAGVTVSGVWDHLVKIAGSGDIGAKDNLAVRYELHAPQEPVTASGTIMRGTGVYFKLRPSRQTALEGSRSFTLVFRAPRTWRGDYLQVHCEASGVYRGVVRSLDEPFRGGVRDYFVGMYRAGDAQAKQAAERMVDAERTLRQSLLRHRASLVADSNGSVVDQLASIWKPAKRSVGGMQRIEQLIFSTNPLPATISADLPGRLGASLEAYLIARTELRGLSRH